MKKVILILLLLTSTKYFSQSIPKINTPILEGIYQTNFQKQYYNLGLSYRARIVLMKRINLFYFGGGINYYKQDYLIDANIKYAISQGYISNFGTNNERFATFYFGLHYKFNNQSNLHFLSPEFGYNFYILPHLYISPSINYFINLNQKERFTKGIYPTITAKFLLSKLVKIHFKEEPRAKF